MTWYHGWWTTRNKGSDTSGNYQHRGRKGKKGGSLPGGGHGAIGIGSGDTPDQKRAKVGEHRQAQAKKKKRQAGSSARAPQTAEEARNRLSTEGGRIQAQIKALRAEGMGILEKIDTYRVENTTPLITQKVDLYTQGFGKDSPEIQAIDNQLAEHKKVQEAMWAEHIENSKQIGALMEEKRKLGMSIVSVPEGQRADVRLEMGRLRKGRAEAQEGVDLFSQLVGTGTVDGEWVDVVRTNKTRAFYTPLDFPRGEMGAVSLSTRSGRRTMLHEMGHWLEDRDATIHAKALAFLDRRTQGENAIKLSSTQPNAGYADYEITKMDKFSSPYMGKVYEAPGLGRYATEIISMGLEELYGDPFDFSQRDPDYFDFMWNTLRGK